LRDEGKINLPSWKVQELRAAVARTPDVYRIVYHEKGVMKSFVIPGWLDSETLQGPDVLVIFRTLKRKYSVVERNKWIADLPTFIQDMHQFGYVRESTFDRLCYPVDHDRLGNQHLLPDTLITQPHRQRFLLTTNDHLRSQFLDRIAKSKEGVGNASEQEMIDRQNILKANKEAEAKLHVLAGRDGDNCRSEFADNPPTLQHFHKLKGKFLKPFVLARLCTHSKGKIAGPVGKPSDVQVILDKLSADPGYPITSKEDSLLLRAFLNKSATDLTLKVEEASEQQDSEERDTSDVSPTDLVQSLFDNPELLAEVVACVVNLDTCIAFVTAAGRARRDDLACMIRVRLERFKRSHLKSVSQLANHWTIAAFEDNIVPMSELVVLLRLVTGNVGAIGYGKSLLRSMSAACELAVTEDELSPMQGVAIVRDTQRGAFVNVAKASGTDNTFKTMAAKLETAAKKPTAGNRLANGYPFKRPSAVMRGDAKGTFSDLEMLVGIAIDPNCDSDCLTRLSDGMFHWSERTINKLDNTNSQDKRLALVLSMCALFVNLMLDLDDSLSQGSFFGDFMNDFNLLTKKVA
jgi:hypothetical protein